MDNKIMWIIRLCNVDMRSDDIMQGDYRKVAQPRRSALHARSPSGRVMHTLRPWILACHRKV